MANVSRVTSRAIRKTSTSSYTSGFYRALNAYSSADSAMHMLMQQSSSTLRLATDSDELPPGCFLVERLISTRRHKVGHIQLITIHKI